MEIIKNPIYDDKLYSEENIKALCDRIRNISYAIHLYLGHGHLEKVYEKALANRLKKSGFEFSVQHPITVYDEDGTIIGDYIADMIIQNSIIIEIKAAKNLTLEHESQIIGYLKSSKIEHGLLINFGSYKFEIRKFALSQK